MRAGGERCLRLRIPPVAPGGCVLRQVRATGRQSGRQAGGFRSAWCPAPCGGVRHSSGWSLPGHQVERFETCQRPFSHYAGVAEIPTFRILPDYKGKRSGASF
ncbi:MAG: arabinosyltransferase C-terminal domain-containing protein, partial [Neisseria elongata]